MILIEYGEHKELFITDAWEVPDAIKELYRYVKGRIDEDLFCLSIEGLRTAASTFDMVRLYNSVACETPIHQIFTGANQYWRADDDS